ncbi:MAG: ABC transporter ATP-binding protein [Acidobacteria bacterium]|nr:ABC transporter ATP-binding protein [Acidobacteriota bacterium]
MAAETTGVSKLFGNFAALRQVTCSFAAGGLHVLLGENGAGKSTLVRVFAGLSGIDAGTVHVLGKSPRESQGRVAYMSHAPMLYEEMTAMENLQYFAALYSNGKDCGCSGSPEMALRSVGLDPHLTRPVSLYSQGMRQRVSLARVLMADPELLLLDEPFSNMDMDGARQMLDLLLDFRTWPSPGGARTIILTTHQAELVLPVADSVLRLHRGKVVSEAAA